MKNNAPISVVLPVYNCERFLSESILSILNQTFSNFKLIIVDDCSTDGSGDIVRNFSSKDDRIELIRNTRNLKLANSLNTAICASNSKYIARMDADDISALNRLELQYDFLEKNQNVVIVGSNMDIIDEDGSSNGCRMYYETDSRIRDSMFFYSPFCHPAIMMRSSALDVAGLYRSNFNPAEDYELYFRLGRVGEFANIPKSLLKYRVVSSSMTNTQIGLMEQMSIQIKKKYFGDAAYPGGKKIKLFIALHSALANFLPVKLKISIFNILKTLKI